MGYYHDFKYPDSSEPALAGDSGNVPEAIGQTIVWFEELDEQLSTAISFLLRRGDGGQVDGQVSTDLSDICPSLRDGQVEVDSSEMTCPSCGTPPKAIYPSGLCGDCDAAEVAQ